MESEEAKGDVVTFDKEKVTVKTKQREQLGTYKLNPSKNPKAIDFMPGEGPMKDKPHPGIYELTGDTLRICYVHPEKQRPTAFESKSGSGANLVTLKREKGR
jgi:uncharacterized protein (TIGR03067 family)